MDWVCESCTYKNKGHTITCEICLSSCPSSMKDNASRKRTRAPDPPKGKKKAWKPQVVAFKEDERMIQKKINQMRECLGNNIDDEQIKRLLQKNAGSVSFAIASYYETLSKTQENSNKTINDSKYWIQSMNYKDYYLGACTIEAHLTRREEGTIKAGTRLSLRSEGSILRIMSMNNVILGRIDEAWENILLPLLNSNYLKIGANVFDAPMKTTVFSRFQLQLHVFAIPDLWTCFKSDQISTNLKENLFHLIEAIHNRIALSPSSIIKLPGETNENINPDTDVDALYSSSVVDHLYDSDKVHSKLNGIYLRPYQEQALQWMLKRELYKDNASDGKSIGLSLRLEDKSNHDPEVHPLWDKRNCTQGYDCIPTQYYMNTFERLVSLNIPPPPRPCLGGVLADDMGMGKTIMIIALVLARTHVYTENRSTNEVITSGQTLVVCPLSLLHQWKHEFETRAPSLKVYVHYETKFNQQEIAKSNVVLTTYGIMGSEYEKKCSGFSDVVWDRLILDEAHSIKNRSTTYFKSCSSVQATHRWCLTGTPIQNSLEDVLSLLTFLRYEPWNKVEWWNRVVAQPYEKGEKCALVRLKAILQPILLRRTKYSRDPATNELIVQLPPKKIETIQLQFTPEERQFYKAVYTKSQGEFYGYVANGTAATSYVAIFALLLRLRQACDHPFLVVGKDVDINLKKKTQSKKAIDKALTKEAYYAELSTMIQEASKGDTNEEHSYIKNRILEIQEEGLDCQECPVCLDVPISPVITPCAHLLCKECILSFLRNNEESICPVCRAALSQEHLIPVEPPEKQIVSTTNKISSASSSKLNQLLVDLKSVENDRKVIVFSQWAHMLDLIGKTLTENGYTHVRFDGSLKQDDREKVLQQFNTNPKVQVLVISLKAGGVGLNLTAASVVIMMDPWWNPGIEDQAIDRVHRLGQTRDVVVKKYIVQDTVEEMILELQKRKATLASTVLATAKSGTDNDGRLSLSDLLKFFA